jgi:hypothetical protein
MATDEQGLGDLSGRRLFARALRSLPVWGWALLSAVPPDALSTWRGWDKVDPAYLGLLVAWWPVDTLLQLLILAWLLKTLLPGKIQRKPWAAVAAALNAEALLSVRLGIVVLLGLVPALVLVAVADVQALWVQLLFLLLVFLGVLPAFSYYLRRSLAPIGVLLFPLRGAEALDWSQGQLAGRLKAFAKLALPWWILSAGLDGLSLCFGDSGWGLSAAWILGVPSLVAGLMPLVLFVADSETT